MSLPLSATGTALNVKYYKEIKKSLLYYNLTSILKLLLIYYRFVHHSLKKRGKIKVFQLIAAMFEYSENEATELMLFHKASKFHKRAKTQVCHTEGIFPHGH